mmetsp:Transcript_22945/g.65016  ORF Transcript_22945/g.65016 Transcript_22945/m.65016 type:complete len:303 (-) Transcript_22945:321-1229(-)|eukprot:CAMPEP_0119558504 /NCGR_PEP_ID=MMETSP1352-20130426/10834_1 /TAXON_ID=265584 /ORGANISM="Stauroneis constricta, Strain CCMP1120" /LENGTH=302 /DNA_ID=CAMNT_0007605889 /DNA_START=211 /DNA_END=1119 /DNA_ORIENTATION=-
MQKRRVHAAENALPLTNADIGNASNGNKGKPMRSSRMSASASRTRRRNAKSRSGCMPICCVLIALIGGIGYFSLSVVSPEKKDSLHKFINKHKETLIQKRRDLFSQSTNSDSPPLPLDEFESLQYALKNSRLVGLYFGASWCPICTPFTKFLDDTFHDVLLPPPEGSDHDPPAERADFAIVYVSSDKTEEEMREYIKDKNWMAVPFESEERAALKKHFQACAKRELKELQMERKYEIPTLMILDGETHGILSRDGVEDALRNGEDSLEHWNNMATLTEQINEEVREREEKEQEKQHAEQGQS